MPRATQVRGSSANRVGRPVAFWTTSGRPRSSEPPPAMGGGALVYLEGGEAEAVYSAVALTLKSVLGLVCDPVGGLVEAPCIKRNGTLAAIGALSADMALAGIKSIIPADEVIDAMGRVGKSIPPSLRETSLGGLAVTPTARELVREMREKK